MVFFEPGTVGNIVFGSVSNAVGSVSNAVGSVSKAVGNAGTAILNPGSDNSMEGAIVPVRASSSSLIPASSEPARDDQFLADEALARRLASRGEPSSIEYLRQQSSLAAAPMNEQVRADEELARRLASLDVDDPALAECTRSQSSEPAPQAAVQRPPYSSSSDANVASLAMTIGADGLIKVVVEPSQHGKVDEQIRADEALARRLASDGGPSSIDYLRSPPRSPAAAMPSPSPAASMPSAPPAAAWQPTHPFETTPAAPGAWASPGAWGGMLLVGGLLGGFGCEVLVDTGAQSSVLSAPLMNRLHLRRSLDRSMQGVAQGVGTARIIGQCRDVPLELGAVEFLCSFTVLDVDAELCMLGLDMLRTFKCIVDLERGVLIFGGQGGVEVPFLPAEQAVEWNRFARGGLGGDGAYGGCTLM